jgi:putative nucleotidyltransferase with HDIG domain/diguanylate cyclase (GGDEF)-like protein
MGFSNLPRKAQIYLFSICLLGLAAVAAVTFLQWPKSPGSWVEVSVFSALATMLGGKKITLFKGEEDDAVSMSLGFVITFAGTLRFGPSGAIMLGAISCLAGCLYPKRQPTYQLLFNVALGISEAFTGSVAYLALNGWSMQMQPVSTFFAVCGGTAAYFLVNTGGVSIIIGLCSLEKPWKIWRETFLWTGPSYIAGACVSALAMVVFGSQHAYILLFMAPVAWFMHQSYSIHTSRSEEKLRHVEEMQQNQARLADLYLATIKSLALAIDAKDQYTHQHILRVQRYAVAIAIEMGLKDGDLEAVNTGALLHDIGKLGVPEYVLLKPGRLSDEEFDKIKQHPEIGAAILDPVEFPWPVLPVVKYHHEKWDGTGYPEGIAGENIPLAARIMAVADVYDALTSSRSYRNAWTHERAFEVICKDAGTHFDPIVVDAFKNVIDGVVQEMAEQGEGPLAAKPYYDAPTTKAAEAAKAISRTSSDMWAVYEVAETLSAGLALKDSLAILSKKLQDIFQDSACVFLLDDGTGCLKAVSAVGANAEFFTDSKTIGDHGKSKSVATSSTSYRGDYDSDDLLLSASATSAWQGIHSSVIVPIDYEGKNLGTLNLYDPCADAYSESDMQFLETLAQRAGTAIFNGLLRDQNVGNSVLESRWGLSTLAEFTEAVDRRCSTGEKTFISCIDLIGFKPINDVFGHTQGDIILQELAQLVLTCIGPDGTAARSHADQFFILPAAGSREDLGNLLDSIQKQVRNLNHGMDLLGVGKIQLDIAWGIGSQLSVDLNAAQLMAAARTNLDLMKAHRKLKALARKHSADNVSSAA